jgi:hypothetical protein
MNELRQKCQLIMAAKRSEQEAIERDARLRARRHLRFGTTDEGAVSIRGELAPVEGAAVKNALERMSKKVFETARAEGRRESHDAYMADALLHICLAGLPPAPSSGLSASPAAAGSSAAQSSASPGAGGFEAGAIRRTPRAEIVLHVSAEALRRGEIGPGEYCEIEGVGPVSLATVEYLFGDAWAKLVIEKGVDIASVTHFGRNIPAHLDTALRKRDRVCQVPGCGITWGLERDHIVGVEDGGPTELANLAMLCHRHHLLKTNKYWRLIGSPGNWEWVNIRPEQDTVAEGDYYDVARPGEPTAGLARPVLRPREPIEPLEPASGAKDLGHEFFTQGSFTCPKADTVVVLRLTPALLASLGRTGNHPSTSGHSLGCTGNHPSTSGHSLGAQSTGSHSTGSHSTGAHSTGAHSNSTVSTTGGDSTGAHSTGGDSTGAHSTGAHSTGAHSTGGHSAGPQWAGPQWAGGHPTKGHGSTEVGELLALAPASSSARKSRSSALALMSFGRRRLATATTSPRQLHDGGYSCTLLDRERPVGMARRTAGPRSPRWSCTAG